MNMHIPIGKMRGFHKFAFSVVIVAGFLFVFGCIRNSATYTQRTGGYEKQSRDLYIQKRPVLNQYLDTSVYTHNGPTNNPLRFIMDPTNNHKRDTQPPKDFTNKKAPADSQTIAERFQKRKANLQEACVRQKLKTNLTECERKDLKFNLKNATGSHVVYCAIEKAGSTFWKRILQVIDSRNNLTSPLQINTMGAEFGNSYTEMSNSSLDAIKDLTDKYTSILFVRNPYTRLFSAWLDKFYSVNTPYWKSVAVAIVKQERQPSTFRKCEYDVTFSELVNYISKIVKTDFCFDRHFATNYDHCDPCNINFDYIGNYETLDEDTRFILKSLNLTKQIELPSDAEGSDAIKDGAHWIFYQKQEIAECEVSFACAMFRVWQRLQSRGIISNKLSFPLKSKSEAETLTESDFEMVLRTAHALSKPEDLCKNRHEALAQALKSLSGEVENNLLEAYQLDFEMFGYEKDLRQYVQAFNSEYQYFQECPEYLR